MVNLTRIYTRGGDAGDTSLGDGSRVSKASARIAAYGTVDELNAHIGVLRTLELPAGWDAWLARIQNELFDLGADLCVPEEERPDRSSERERTRLRVDPSQVEWLEARCDEVNDALPPLTSFILPGRHARRRAAARLPHGLPPRRARDRRARRARAGQPRGDGLRQPPLGPAVHPRPRGQPAGLRAALAAGRFAARSRPGG